MRRGASHQPIVQHVDGPSLRDAAVVGSTSTGSRPPPGRRMRTTTFIRSSNNGLLLSEAPPNSGSGAQAPPQAGQNHRHQQQQVYCWERFLQKKRIRVLLAESDDSTRQVVSALLRHCMYEVIPAENGQQAWSYLEDMQNSIDLVLAEVFMPGGSGISLLSKIMSHNTCKNIPVIMMSSSDAMSTVFKCLSKGAVDFLVKPIRKNGLKNLWQHVWRRCHSSSWTKRAVEIDSPHAMSPDQLADPPDSTCAQVIHPKSEICNNRWLPDATNRYCKKQKETNDNFKGKDMEIGGPRNLNLGLQSSLNERSNKPADDRRREFAPERNSKGKNMENLKEPTVGAADLIGSMARNMDAQQAARSADAPNCSSKVPDQWKDKNHDNVLPSLGLSLKRSRSSGDGANAIQDEKRNVLIRSDPSAFTRYHTSAVSNQGGTGLEGSCSPQDNSSETMKIDSTTYNTKSNSDAAQRKQGSNGSSNNNDMGSSTKNVVPKPTTNKDKFSMSPSAIKTNAHTSAFHPVQHWTSPPANATGKAKAVVVANNAAKNGEVQSNLMKHSRPILDYATHSREKGWSGAPLSNVFNPPLEGQAANYGVMSGSNTGSNTGTNGQNQSTAAANRERTNMEIASNGSVDKIGPVGGGNGSSSGTEAYAKRYAVIPERTLREKQLFKYREKKKDRNFGKKVRYQSRKNLADQRPRVRGQFVKQDKGGRDADTDR